MIRKSNHFAPPPMPKEHQQRIIQDLNDLDGIYWNTTSENALNSIRALAGEKLYLEWINDKRIPVTDTWRDLTFFFRRVQKFIQGHDFSWWTVENMINAGLQKTAEIKEPEEPQTLTPAAADALENWQEAIRDTNFLADEHRPETSAAQSREIEAKSVFIHSAIVTPTEVAQ